MSSAMPLDNASADNPTLMIQMIAELGPLDASRRLLDKGEVSEGFTRLWELRRLDLTVEAIALRPELSPLFTAEQLATARERLAKLGFHVPGNTGPPPAQAPILRWSCLGNRQARPPTDTLVPTRIIARPARGRSPVRTESGCLDDSGRGERETEGSEGDRSEPHSRTYSRGTCRGDVWPRAHRVIHHASSSIRTS